MVGFRNKNIVFSGKKENIMRRIRIFSVIIFVLAVGSFAGFRVYNFLNSDYAGPQITMDSDTITISCGRKKKRHSQAYRLSMRKMGM